MLITRAALRAGARAVGDARLGSARLTASSFKVSTGARLGVASLAGRSPMEVPRDSWQRDSQRAAGAGKARLALGVGAVAAASLVTASAARSAADSGGAGLPPLEAAKRLAARSAVDAYVRPGMVVGVGSGSTIVHAIAYLGELKRERGLDVVCVPTSFQSRQLVVEHGLTLGDLDRFPVLDVAIDGADEVDRDLNCIKGGGGCQAQEKIVAAAAKTFVVIADHSKQSEALGTRWRKGVPIEVLPMAYRPLTLQLEAMGGAVVLRMAKAKAGPVVTDNGNFILDVDFGTMRDPKALEERVGALVGVVETGLFCGMAREAFFGQADGSVVKWTDKKRR